MLTKSGCGACQNLKQSVNNGKEFRTLLDQFVVRAAWAPINSASVRAPNGAVHAQRRVRTRGSAHAAHEGWPVVLALPKSRPHPRPRAPLAWALSQVVHAENDKMAHGVWGGRGGGFAVPRRAESEPRRYSRQGATALVQEHCTTHAAAGWRMGRRQAREGDHGGVLTTDHWQKGRRAGAAHYPELEYLGSWYM